MEPKHERCVECGHRVNLQEPDPDLPEVGALLGESLRTLGEISVSRPKLPSFGVLSAFQHGLLFLPDVHQLPTGGIVSVEPASSRGGRTGFWNLFSRHVQSAAETVLLSERPQLTTAAAAERFLDSPGALFIKQESILRIQLRGTLFRIERQPGRTVACRVESPASLREGLQKLKGFADWAKVPMAVGS